MMFGQQPYVYQQPIYNQPIGQPISQPMQEPMMRPQYQPAPQMPAYQRSPSSRRISQSSGFQTSRRRMTLLSRPTTLLRCGI